MTAYNLYSLCNGLNFANQESQKPPEIKYSKMLLNSNL